MQPRRRRPHLTLDDWPRRGSLATRVASFVSFERRLETPRWVTALMPIASAVVALAIVAVVLAISGHDPVAAYRTMFQAAVTSDGALSATLVNTTPLLLTGLAAAIAFRMRVWNIGGEGQLYVGAIGAAGVGVALGSHGLAIALPAMVLAGAACGALWAGIAGLLRAYLSTNEILTSLMLNYVAGLLTYYLIFDSDSYWRDLSSASARVFPEGKAIPGDAFWPGFTNGSLVVPLGMVLGVVCATGLFVLVRSTRFGFSMRVIADNPRAAGYAGIRTKRTLVLVMLLSGALAGVAGASQVGDFSHLLDPKGLQQASYGYTGIVVAALARFNPLGVIAAAAFLGGLTDAGFKLQGPSFPLGLVGTIEGVILFCVLGGEVMRRYRVRVGRPRAAPPSLVPDADESPPVAVGEGTT